MRTNYIVPVLLILLSSLLLSACEAGGASTSRIITPLDTSARTLVVTIGITEDQDATNNRSKITFQFRTVLVAENNSVRFTHQEAVSCNGVPLKLDDAPVYTLSVPRLAGYNCSYTGYTQRIGQLAPVTLINVAARSGLMPQRPSFSSQGYTISYTRDASGHVCTMMADAIDDAGAVISGSPALSDLGVYHGPATGSLAGTGIIRLQRTCFLPFHAPFTRVSLTYQSTAAVAVTWSS